jgi:hypothetical protein
MGNPSRITAFNAAKGLEETFPSLIYQTLDTIYGCKFPARELKKAVKEVLNSTLFLILFCLERQANYNVKS